MFKPMQDCKSSTCFNFQNSSFSLLTEFIRQCYNLNQLIDIHPASFIGILHKIQFAKRFPAEGKPGAPQHTTSPSPTIQCSDNSNSDDKTGLSSYGNTGDVRKEVKRSKIFHNLLNVKTVPIIKKQSPLFYIKS